MNRQTISTIIVIICILIIGLYAMGEVNYFSSKIAVERNVEAPTIVIPSIGVGHLPRMESARVRICCA